MKNIILIAAAAAAYVYWTKNKAPTATAVGTGGLEPNPAQTLDTVAKNAAVAPPEPFSTAAKVSDMNGGGGAIFGSTSSNWQTGGLEPQAQAKAAAPVIDRAAIFKAQGLVEAPWAPGNYVTPEEAGGYANALAIRQKNDAELTAMNLFH